MWNELHRPPPAPIDPATVRAPGVLGGRPVFRGTRVPVDVPTVPEPAESSIAPWSSVRS